MGIRGEIMKLYKYEITYPYEDMPETMLVKANSEDEAIEKLHDYKVKHGAYFTEIKKEYVREVYFNNDGIADM